MREMSEILAEAQWRYDNAVAGYQALLAETRRLEQEVERLRAARLLWEIRATTRGS